MADLHVPVSVFQISLQLRGTTSASVWTQTFFEDALRQTNSIWQQANISFDLRDYTPENFELLNADSNLNLTNGNDIMFLLSRHRGQNGLGVCLVNMAITRDGNILGGYYEGSFKACLLSHMHTTEISGINLAHEFGHALIGSGHTGDSTNLMQTHSPAASNTRLTRSQINTARGAVPQITA
jgi:hypothetical protein